MAKPWRLLGKMTDHVQIILDDRDVPVGNITTHRKPGQRRSSWAVRIKVYGEDPVFVGPYLECIAFAKGIELAAEKSR